MTALSNLRPETRLIAACCRRSDDPERLLALDRGVEAIRDWTAFPDAVLRHRVHPQVYDALADNPAVPTPVRDILGRRARNRRMRGLRQLSELLRLTDLLGRAGIRVTEMKGMTLGMLAYGTTGLKESLDIDLLVAPDDADAALRLLLDNGYSHAILGQQVHARQVAALARNRKDIALHGNGSSSDGIKLELHWRLSHGSGLLRGAGEHLPRQAVAVHGARTVTTLATPDLVAYLAVHGSLHNWGRIKWLADFDALVRRADESTRQSWRDHAQARGAGRCLDYALAMSHTTFGPFPNAPDPVVAHQTPTSHALTTHPSSAQARTAQARTAQARTAQARTARAAAAGLRAIEAPYPPPDDTLGQKVAILRDDLVRQVPLFPRKADTRSLLRLYLFVEKDILRFPLPARCRYLYPLMRGFIWASERIRPGAAR